jgi:hypothetical protein
LRQRISHISKYTLLASFQVAFLGLTCNAAIRFELTEVSVVVSGSQSAVGNIDAVVRANPSDLPQSVSSFNLDFHTTSTSLSLSPAQAAPNPLINGAVSNFSTDSHTVLAGEDVFPASASLFDGAGLVRVPFQVPFGSSGVFALQFGARNELTDSNASPLPIEVTDVGSVTVIVATTGDYNHNGVVDAADYVTWRDTLGSTTSLAADGDQNGTVAANDYAVWRSNFGHTGSYGLGAFSVPEPSSIALSLTWLAMSSLLAGRGCRIGR